MRDTSLAARPMDTAAQRAAILALFEREPYQPSREAVSQKTGIKLQTMTWRIRDLLAEDAIEELDAVDNKHPLRRKNAEQMPERANVGTAPLSLPVDICSAPNNAAGRECSPNGRQRVASNETHPPAPAAPNAATTRPSNEPMRVFSGLVGVQPYAGYPYWEMSEQSAKAIVADGKRNGMYEFAEKRLAMK